jgi:hypothetical protein
MPGTTPSVDLFAQSRSPLEASNIPSSTLLGPTTSQDSLGLPSFASRSSAASSSSSTVSSDLDGSFTVGRTGQVGIDYLFDGGGYEGELAIFSLSGLDFTADRSTLMSEIVRRALSDTVEGHVVIRDAIEGARFTGELGEANTNAGDYRGVQTFTMTVGDHFGVMLTPNSTIAALKTNPNPMGRDRPLFSMVGLNPLFGSQVGQIADVDGKGSTFVMEDLRVDGESDRDYNDIIFQVRGAIGSAVSLDDLPEFTYDWREQPVGKDLMRFIQPPVNQPLIGIIDTGLNASNPDIDPFRIHFGANSDYVAGDGNPLLRPGEGSQHGTFMTGIIAATPNNGIGIDGINDQAPIYVQRAIGSGQWAKALTDFVDAAKEMGQPHAIANLSLDLTQPNPNGTIGTRYEFTPQERQALEYARQSGVLIVAAAGNTGGTMSALGQASQEFDNIITVGAINSQGKRANYSSFGYGLDLVAYGGTLENPVISTVGSGTDLPLLAEAIRVALGSESKEIHFELSNELSDQQTAFRKATVLPHSHDFSGDQVDLQQYLDAPDSSNLLGSSIQSALTGGFTSETANEVDEDLPQDEMSTIALNIFEEAFGALRRVPGAKSEGLDDFTPEERQVYEEATKEIDQLLSDYLGAASQKLALEYVDGYYAAQVEALSQFVEAFDENTVDTLLKAQAILQEAGLNLEPPNDNQMNPFASLDFGIGGMAGTSVATAQVTGVASQVWAANPKLSYAQVKDILKRTATDLNTPGWDKETGSGAVNLKKAVELAKQTQPEIHHAQPILSPLTWTGEGKLFPGEQAVFTSVPSFQSRLLNAGYVSSVGYLRIRSGPGTTGNAEVGRKYPGDTITFDAYENNGGWVPDPYMPGGGSSRWYRIAGTNTWMSGLYFDTTPEQAEQERQRQDAIRRAEEAARLAEEALRRAAEEARAAEEELRRIEAEQRRIEAERQRQREQFQALVNQITQKHGDPGVLLGSWVSNGVVVYQFATGQLLIQPDGRTAFYKSVIEPFNKYAWTPFQIGNFIQKDLISRIPALSEVIDSTIKSRIVDPQGFFKTLDATHPLTRLFPPDLVLDGSIATREFFENGFGKKVVAGINDVGTFLNTPVVKRLGSNSPVVGDVIDLGFLATDLTLGDEKAKRRALLKAGTMGFAGIIGAGVGALGFGAGAVPLGIGSALAASALTDIAYLAFDLTGNSEVLDNALEGSFKAVENGWNAATSAMSSAVEALKKKAQEAQQKAQDFKVAFQATKVALQQAQVAQQNFKQELQKQTTQIVQQSQQKMKEVAQSIAQKVVNNPVVQAAAKVGQQIYNYAQKAVQTVSNVINGAKQFVGSMVEAGKQVVSKTIETVKQTYQAVTNFVSEKVDQGKQFVAETYNKAAQATNTITNFFSGGFNQTKSFFGW